MNFFIALCSFFSVVATKAFANPACVVCTVAIGASLEIARKLGISDDVVGLWAGALFALLGYWAILWFNKKNWYFWGRDALLMISSVGMLGFMYMGELTYFPKVIGFLYIDSFLLSGIIGAAIYIYVEKLYDFMKRRNGGHAHFPFEKVVMPVVSLLLVSMLFNYYPL